MKLALALLLGMAAPVALAQDTGFAEANKKLDALGSALNIHYEVDHLELQILLEYQKAVIEVAESGELSPASTERLQKHMDIANAKIDKAKALARKLEGRKP